MLTIRLSDEEYEGLKTLCVERGARSVSDLAREAVGHMLHLGPRDERIDQLQGRLDLLDQRLAEVMARLAEKG